MTKNHFNKLLILLLLPLSLVVSGLTGCGTRTDISEKIKVAGVFSTPREEPWVAAVHQALLTAERELDAAYDFTENVGPGDFEAVLREYAERSYEVIFGDAFGNEEIARRVARDYPEIAFCFGSGFGPVEPNFSVFDNWIQEPAYLCGLIAGGFTETNILGAVGGKPVPEVNRLLNAFRRGAKETNPDARVIISFIDEWFDPPAARSAALAQIEAGADLIYAERYGVIEACREKRVLAFGNIQDQNSLAPDTVVTGPVWDMWPTVKEVITSVEEGSYQAQDLAPWSMMAKNGAFLASYHSFDRKLPPKIKEMVDRRRRKILDGLFRVPVCEIIPRSD